ncbi:MAG: type III pantothenate kinase [Bacteroidaceae bacterium]|nr:type III pantothenate kinase [Bacteroidaceae bacterium]
MKILLDIGNTCAKVAVVDHKDIVHFEHRNEGWNTLFQRLTTTYAIDECAISNVAGVDKELLHALESQPYPIRWFTYETPNPLFPDAKAPRGLGADRWAADIGAMSLAKKDGKMPYVLVIDAGTCITYDLIEPTGDVFKGAISPGVGLRLKAMHEHTALLPLIDPEGEVELLGLDTDTALRSGAVMGAALEIEGFIRRLVRQYPDLMVYVTGGSKIEFDADIVSRITIEPMLIFKGLMEVCYKATK